MPRPCACGAIENLNAVLGDIGKWEHRYDKCLPEPQEIPPDPRPIGAGGIPPKATGS